MKSLAVKVTVWLCLLTGFLLPVAWGQDNKPEQWEKKQLIVYNGAVPAKETVLSRGPELLVPVQFAASYIDQRLYFDSDEKKLYLYLPHPEFRLETPALDGRLFEGLTLNFPTRRLEGIDYLNLQGLQALLGIRVEAQDDGTLVLVPEPQKKRRLAEKRPVWRPAGKLNLVWDALGTAVPADGKGEKIAGLEIVSPTWFSISSEGGLVSSKADAAYVEEAHRKGYKVWALINNSFDKDLTRQILQSEDAQERVIRQLLVYSSLYHLDGINLDFENIYREDKDKLTRFVSRIATALREQGVVVSLDMTVPQGSDTWSQCYDRKGLAAVVDYVMVMTYDETWRSSPRSGSVASLNWVERGIQATLAEVPAEKLLLGLPFYMREWEEPADGQGPAKATTLSMVDAERKIREKNLTLQWLEDKGQYYTEYYEQDKRYRIWLEDERSIAAKVALVGPYRLAGVASWRKGFERETIWPVIQAGLQPATHGAAKAK